MALPLARLVQRRRLLFLWFNVILFALAVAPMIELLGSHGWSFLRCLLLLVFLPLMAQVVFGFTLAATGFILLLRDGDPFRINSLIPSTINNPPSTHPSPPSTIDSQLSTSLHSLLSTNPPGSPSTFNFQLSTNQPPSTNPPPTAIVMPIFNEDVARVFQGLRVIFESLEKTGRGQSFDFFILSDSHEPNHWIAEEMAWLDLCKQVSGFGRIFYRKRRVRLHHKSGNIADFCRRWGNLYRYMIVLDADSVMTGAACVRLVELIEAKPQVGIIQTNPRLVFGQTLMQRILQFGSQLCSPIFAAGMNFWQADSGNFWGHNAIIRLKPFMKYCATPELPENGPFGRRVFSHDTVEAALMRRAGYEVWFAYDLEGSYEEGPPHLLASLQRDRRWCFGNLQHLWFLFGRNLRPASRLHLLNGIMSYASSPLWLAFLALSSLLAVLDPVPAPAKPSFETTQGSLLFAAIMFLLLAPKACGLVLLLRSPRAAAALGGRFKLLLSAAGETLYSIILAPTHMLFFTRFVWDALLGSPVSWKPQARAGNGIGWGTASKLLVGHTIVALGWLALLAWWQPAFLPWMCLVFFGLIAAIPFTVLTSSRRLGLRARQANLFLTFDEVTPAPELKAVEEIPPNYEPAFFRTPAYAADFGLLRAVLDPYVNSVHISLLRQRTKAKPETRKFLLALMERLLKEGPGGMDPREKTILLWDADSMLKAHRKLWSSPGSVLHGWWQAAFRHYNESQALALRRSLSGL